MHRIRKTSFIFGKFRDFAHVQVIPASVRTLIFLVTHSTACDDVTHLTNCEFLEAWKAKQQTRSMRVEARKKRTVLVCSCSGSISLLSTRHIDTDKPAAPVKENVRNASDVISRPKVEIIATVLLTLSCHHCACVALR